MSGVVLKPRGVEQGVVRLARTRTNPQPFFPIGGLIRSFSTRSADEDHGSENRRHLARLPRRAPGGGWAGVDGGDGAGEGSEDQGNGAAADYEGNEPPAPVESEFKKDQFKDENAITTVKDKTTDQSTISKDDKKDLKIEGSKTDIKPLQKVEKPGVAIKPEDKTKKPIQKPLKSGNDY